MTDQGIEDRIRGLGAEWPIPSVRDAVLERLAKVPVRRAKARRRRWPFIVLAGGFATAAAVLIVATIQLSTPATLYAAVERTLEKAGKAHLLIESFDKGTRQISEIWFDKSRGVRTEHANMIVVDDGKSNWMWNSDDQSDGVVLRRPSADGIAMVASMLDLSGAPPDWRKTRSLENDQNVRNAPCKAFVIEVPKETRPQTGSDKRDGVERRAIVLVDGREQPRRVIHQRRVDGEWTKNRQITVEYDAKMDAKQFVAAFPKSSRVVDVEQGLEKLYPIEAALASGESEGIMFAVHKVVPLENGLYYILSSARGTPEFLKKYPPLRRRLNFNYTALDVAGHDVGTGTSSNHYTMKLFHVEWYGVEYSWWILAPYKGARDELVKGGKVTVQLGANCYHPDLRDARGVLKRVSKELAVDVPGKAVDWIDIVRDLRRDTGVVATLWGESESPIVFGSIDKNTLRLTRINDISDKAYADDLQRLYEQLQTPADEGRRRQME